MPSSNQRDRRSLAIPPNPNSRFESFVSAFRPIQFLTGELYNTYHLDPSSSDYASNMASLVNLSYNCIKYSGPSNNFVLTHQNELLEFEKVSGTGVPTIKVWYYTGPEVLDYVQNALQLGWPTGFLPTSFTFRDTITIDLRYRGRGFSFSSSPGNVYETAGDFTFLWQRPLDRLSDALPIGRDFNWEAPPYRITSQSTFQSMYPAALSGSSVEVATTPTTITWMDGSYARATTSVNAGTGTSYVGMEYSDDGLNWHTPSGLVHVEYPTRRRIRGPKGLKNYSNRIEFVGLP